MSGAAPPPVDYHELLGIPPAATTAQVEAAFEQQLAWWDARAAVPRRADRAYADWVRQHLHEARRILRDPSRRRAHRTLRRPLASPGWHARAHQFLDQHNPTAARHTAQEAMVLLPGHPLPWLVGGYAAAWRQAEGEALYQLTEAARLMPAVALPRYLLGEVHAAQHNWPAALARYDEALELAPHSAPMQAAKASALLAIGDDAGAVRLLEPLVVTHPGDEIYAPTLAQAYRQHTLRQLTPVPGNRDQRVWTRREHVTWLRATADRVAGLRCDDPQVETMIRQLRRFADEGARRHGRGGFGMLCRQPAWRLAAAAVGAGQRYQPTLDVHGQPPAVVHRRIGG